MTRRQEVWLYVGLTALAVVLRLVDLGDRPFHHDESQDAYFSYLFYDRGQYEYDPLLHGPLRFYLTALMYAVFGDSDFTARLAPALMGIAMVPLCWLLRPLAGRIAAAAAAVLFAIGPSFLYFSRFAREDIYKAAVTLAMLGIFFRFLERPRRWHPPALGALLAASFAIKESTFITLFVIGTFLIAWLAVDLGRRRRDLLQRAGALGWEPIAWGVTVFLGVYVVLFTTFFREPDHWDGLAEGLSYWLGQHEVGRGGEPWSFYLVVLFGVEWPMLALGALGAVAAFRRPTPFRLFLVWMFVVSLIVYSWAGEKFAWLVLHPLLPLIVLAGMGIETLWRSRGRLAGRVGLGAAAVAGAYLLFSSVSVNALNRADPRELLVSTQSSEAVVRVRDRVLALDRRVQAQTGRPAQVVVDSSEGATFPWAWYFRDLDGIGYLDFTGVERLPPADAMVLTDASRQRLANGLGTYETTKFPFRVWWVRDYGDAVSPGNWAKWMITREPWDETGGMTEWLAVRPGPA